MIKFDKYLDKQLENEELRNEYDALEPEFAIMQAIIDSRTEEGLTQQDLSKITGFAQGDISKIENGNANPSIRTLKRLADGLGKKLVIEFV